MRDYRVPLFVLILALSSNFITHAQTPDSAVRYLQQGNNKMKNIEISSNLTRAKRIPGNSQPRRNGFAFSEV
jgi:hypothetical protein